MNTSNNKTREDALTWWSELTPLQKAFYFSNYSPYTPAKDYTQLTGREIQNIWAVMTTPELNKEEGKDDEPNDLIDWIGKKGLHDTKEILNELKVINLTKENAQLKERVKTLEGALKRLYNALDSCVELTPEIMKQAKQALNK
jgi:hypothetical protein